MIQKIIGVGIDVAKVELVTCIRYSDGSDHHMTVKNTKSGIQKLQRKFGIPKEYKIVMESTGRYYFLSALILSETGYDVRVINPIQAKKYTTAGIRKVKTDKADARILSEMAIQESKLPPPFSLTKDDIKIRQQMGLLQSLEKKLQSLEQMMRGYEECQENLEMKVTPGEEGIREGINHLRKQKEILAGELEKLISQHLSSEKGFTKEEDCHPLLTSIPGISSFVGFLLLHYLDPDAGNAKSWVAYLGLDVSVHQSGNTTRKGRLSKRGNTYLRKRMYSAAWGAIMHNNVFRNYYDSLKKQGRKHTEALLIIARKLLRICYAVLKSKTPFDEKQCLFS
jgi:transposase